MSGTPSTEVLTSTRNEHVVTAARLHRSRERRALGLTLVEGPYAVAAAVEAGADLEVVFALEGDPVGREIAAGGAVRVLWTTFEVLSRVAGTEHPQGPVAVIRTPAPVPLVSRDTVVLFGVSDPGNTGTLIRSAAAFGFAVAVAPDSADPWSPKVVRAGAGAHFAVPISYGTMVDIRGLRAVGLTIVATAPDGDAGRRDSDTGPVALLVGSEAHGLPQEVIGDADVVVSIETSRVESLNAAVAGSILMYDRARRRRSS